MEPITDEHLVRLSALADLDHEHFTRDLGRPEYRDRRVAVALAQGAALHFLDGRTGVKDLDLWTFYAAIPGQDFSFGQRIRHLDFGVSEHGRNTYPADFRDRRLSRWLRFTGRRVDLMVRSLPVEPHARPDVVIRFLRAWLAEGAAKRQRRPAQVMPSNWWLARKAVILIDPLSTRGTQVWPFGDGCASSTTRDRLTC